MFEHIQDEVNARIEIFIADITALARVAARDALAATLGDRPMALSTGRRAVAEAAPPRRQRGGGKRTPEEIAETAEALFEYISANPGQRMEGIAKAMNSSTQELTLPIKKLLEAGRVTTEGQKRATSYFPAGNGQQSAAAPVRRRRRRTA